MSEGRAGGPVSGRLPFFVYGTLRPGQPNHAWALRGRTASEEAATLGGLLLYEGPGYPYAVRCAAGEADTGVRGDLVWPGPAHYDEVLRVLDELEGHTPGGGHNHYERVVSQATRHDGATVAAWVYVAAEPLATRLRSTGVVVAGGDWVRGLAC